jgi:hypothetical protein
LFTGPDSRSTGEPRCMAQVAWRRPLKLDRSKAVIDDWLLLAELGRRVMALAPRPGNQSTFAA